MELRREQILNVHVHAARLPEILDEIEAGLTLGVKQRTLFCANPHSLVVARKDEVFLAALSSADILVPDGSGVVLASRVQGGSIRRRITGSDLMVAIAEQWNTCRDRSFFFLGSTSGVLEKIKARMELDYPSIAVAGLFSPPFHDEFSLEENERMIDKINRAQPTALWVAMTAPKQEKWVYHNRHRLDVPLIGAVGAAFDYFAGTKKRAGSVMRYAGLEWLPRLLREPRRMWRRNLISTPVFLFHVLHQRFSQVPNHV